MESDDCKKLIEYYLAWQNEKGEVQDLKDSFISNADPEAQKNLKLALHDLKAKRDHFYIIAASEPIEHNFNAKSDKKICRIDKVVLERLNQLWNKEGFEVVIGESTRFAIGVELQEDITDNFDRNAIEEGLNTLRHLRQLYTLSISNTKVEKIPATLTQIKRLVCDGCEHIELPSYLTQLTELSCENSDITSLPDEWVNMEGLNCSGSELKSIPDTYTNLEFINMAYCENLEEIPNNVPELNDLIAGNSNLKKLPETLPPNMDTIAIYETPAADDSKVRQRLAEYQERNPATDIYY